RALGAVLVLDRHPRAEVGLAARVRLGVDDGERVEALREEPQAAVQLAQLALAVDVLGVLAAVAERRGRLDLGDDPRAEHRPDAVVLLRHPLVPLGRDVARRLRRRRGLGWTGSAHVA